MRRTFVLLLFLCFPMTLEIRATSPVEGPKLWWERGADKWYYKDDWKGMALSGGRRYRKLIELATRASSGWIVVWGDRFYRLTVNGALVEEDQTSGIIEDHDLTRFLRGSDKVEILIETNGGVVAEGEVVAGDGQRFPFATGDDWEIPGSTRKPTARQMVAEPSTGAFNRSRNGLLLTYNDEERGKTSIAKSFARIQKMNEQGLFLLRRFCPSDEILDLSENTLRIRTERAIQPLIADAKKILEGQAVAAQKAGKFQDAIAAGEKAGHLLASAEAMLESAVQIYKRERDVLHIENCLEIMSSEKVSLPDYSHTMLELGRMLSGARRDQELQDWANVFKATGRAEDEFARIKAELSGIWGSAIGNLDEFPEDQFGWLNARELMSHDPAEWEFNISLDRVACLDLSGQWKFRTDPNNEGDKNDWHSGKEMQKGEWRSIYAPRAWEWQGVQEFNENSPADCPYGLGDRRTGDKPYNGFAWYRKRVFVPAEWSGQSVILKIGAVNNWVRIFVNGEKASDEGTANRAGGEFPIPKEMLRFGEENLIAIQVYNHDNLGGITSGPLCLALKGQTPEIVETPGPLRCVDEIRWPNAGKHGRCVLLASALSPGVVLSTNEPTLWLWGWKMKGYSNPAGLCVMAKGKQRLFQTEEGHPVVFEGEELTENWVLLESGNENTRSVFVVLETRPARIAWEKNALGQWGIRLDFADSVGRAIIACFPGSEKLTENDCPFWSRSLLAYPISASQLCKPDREKLVGDFRLQYDYLVTRDFCGTEPLYVSPLPMLFSYGIKHGYPGLQPERIRQTDYLSEYASYHVAEQPILRFRAPLVDRSKVLKGIGELFGKMSSSANTRGGISEDQMFRDMGEWGFDHCRYAFAFHADWDIPLCRWMGGPLLDNERAWQRLDELVEKCNDNGMTMMLTWFFNEDSPQRDTDNRVRNSSPYWRKRPETRENAYALWRRIAERYKDLPANTISYDFFNEPAYMEPDDWNRIIKELTEIVRSVDKKHMIVIEGGDGWAQPFWCWWMEPTGDANTIYSFHHYGKHWEYAYDEYYPGYRRTYEGSLVDPWVQAILFGIRNRVPIHCGEFGVSQISPDEDYAMWLNDYLAFFERFGIGWNWWNYSGGDIYRTGLVCGKKLSPNLPILRKWLEPSRAPRPSQ